MRGPFADFAELVITEGVACLGFSPGTSEGCRMDAVALSQGWEPCGAELERTQSRRTVSLET